ncbi:hypothetical protein Tco_1150333, partial [Tanacetum coccineum]
FWQIASIRTLEDEEVEITATIDGQLKTITEASLRRHLKLEDADVFEQLALMGYASDSDKLTFQKGMVKKIDSRSKFLMYPRFIKILLNKHQRLLLPHKRAYVAPTLTQKLFSNMRRVSKGYTGVNIPLFSSMLVQGLIQEGEGSTVPGTYTTHDSPLPEGYTLGSDEGSMTLNEWTNFCTQCHQKVASLEQDLKQTKKVYGNAYTKLIMRVKKLEHQIKLRQPKRRARVVISDTKEDLEDPSKQGRRIAEIDQNPSISLIQDKGTSWIQEDAEIQGRTSADTEILLDQEEPTELVEDLGSGEKGEKEISTANISISTASATPEVSTAAENLVYIRRSA